MNDVSKRWDEIVYWVKEMISSSKFDEWERDYKIDIANRMADVRATFNAGEEWLQDLKRALQQGNNLPNWRDVSKLIDFIQSSPGPANSALATIWNPEASIEDRFSAFNADFPADDYMSANLLSVLHLALGATEFPPYKPTGFQNAARILGYDLPQRNVRTEQGAIYQDALEFLDRIISESSARGVSLRDRIDAQGVIWTFGTKSDGFPDWSPEVVREFQAFVGHTPSTDATEESLANEVTDAAAESSNNAREIRPELAARLTLPEIVTAIHNRGLRLDDRTIRRYHLSLKSRGFVILAGVSGTGKTWLAEAYASTIGAPFHREAVAPNWTSNEDLIGYFNPVSGKYHHTPTSEFIQEAASEFEADGDDAREFHLLLDEMNLARIEHYFATFLSAMEELQRYGRASISIPGDAALILTPNIRLIGTVNIDETTHGFADKVFDRAQLIELAATESAIRSHLGDRPWANTLFEIWRAVQPAAPFAFRVIDDINRYIQLSTEAGAAWQEALDEQVEQKILPKFSGNQPGLHVVLGDLEGLLEGEYPLSISRVEAMKSQHEDIGFVSFFN